MSSKTAALEHDRVWVSEEEPPASALTIALAGRQEERKDSTDGDHVMSRILER